MPNTHMTTLGKGWARTAINATIFRRNSIVSDTTYQYVAYYDAQGYVMLAQRKLDSDDWVLEKTQYQGNTADAHNVISIMLDDAGYLHMAWDHHVNQLRYCRSVAPHSLKLTDELTMTKQKEDAVTYPEFYRLHDGRLLFLYRYGESGQGYLILNAYDYHSQSWQRLQDNLISGEGTCNAYWQMAVDQHGTIHLSWVWRETKNFSTNHDMCYAKSSDNGVTWRKSNGDIYELPITQSTAEYACRIPQGSLLANQTAMIADSQGRPFIASYWQAKHSDVPQYHLVYHDGDVWQTQQVSQRETSFHISGKGSLRIPFSRPQILVDTRSQYDKAYILFRDIERDNKISVAICHDLLEREWQIEDLTDTSVTVWEPSYDTELWQREHRLHLFVQNTEQGNHESEIDLPAQDVHVLEWIP